jgi:hypothetical protein
LKFLEERKKAKALAAGEAPTAPVAVEAISSDPKRPTAQNSWKYLVGNGALGIYTVLGHIQFGTVVELWHGED